MTEDLGIVRWFGQSWGAPVCSARTQIDVPAGEPCARCGIGIVGDDQGVMIPYVDADGSIEPSHYHIDCWMRIVVGAVGDDVGVWMRSATGE